MEAEFQVMWPQAKEYLQPPEAGRGKKNRLCPRVSGECVTWLTR